MDKLCDIECFTQRRWRIPPPPPKTTNAHIHYCDRHLEEAEVLVWTPKNIHKLRGKKVYWNPNDFSCSSVLKVWNPLFTHFRQIPMFLPFPVRLQRSPFTFWSTSTVLWRAGPPKGILQGGTRLLWVTGDKLMLVSKFRIWDPIKPLVNFRKCFTFYAAECPDSLDLKDRKYMLYDEMMAFLVTM
jgi:hypothetical protein